MTRHYLMCRPDYFAVEYAINPWMDPTAPVDADLAVAQWETLHEHLPALGHTVEPHRPGPRPARHGLRRQRRHRRRRPVLRRAVPPPGARRRGPGVPGRGSPRSGFDVHEAKHVNEGEGDFLLAGDHLLAGTGFRTDLAAHARGAGALRPPGDHPAAGRPALLPPGHRAVRAATGDERRLPARARSRRAARRCCAELFPDAVIATAADAAVLGLNAVSDGTTSCCHAAGHRPGSASCASAATSRSPVDLSELHKAGGGPKCCTLEVRA